MTSEEYNQKQAYDIGKVLVHFGNGGKIQGWNGRTNRWKLTTDPMTVVRHYVAVLECPIRIAEASKAE